MAIVVNKTRQRKQKADRPPVAVAETGVVVTPFTTTTQFGKPICMADSIRNLKPGQSFRIDDHTWRRRITSIASYLKIKVSTHRMPDDRLLVTRLK